jgi:tetratricopeptide (TPR) repeat protein
LKRIFFYALFACTAVGAGGAHAQKPAAKPAANAPKGGTPAKGAPAAPATPKDNTFAPVDATQQPLAETASADKALKAGSYEQAITDAKRALGRNERYVPAMIVLAKAYCSLRKLELCGSILDTASQIDDKNGEVYFLRGELALLKDDKTQALAAFKASTDRDPNQAVAWNDLSAQYLYAHNFEQAQVAAAQAVKLQPNFLKAHINLGSALRGLKQYREAEAEYRRALQLDGNNATAYYNLGILYLDADQFPGMETMGRLDQAIANLQRYKQVASFHSGKEDPIDSYIDEAQKARERERKKQERMQKEAQRAQPKPGPNGQPAPAPNGQPKPAVAPNSGQPTPASTNPDAPPAPPAPPKGGKHK